MRRIAAGALDLTALKTHHGSGQRAETGARSVVLVDDVEDLRVLARLALDDDPNWSVVGEAADGNEAVVLCGEVDPDVVLLDLEMPWLDGAEAIPGIRRAAPAAQIVIWTVAPDGVRAVDAVRLGASAVLDKANITPGGLPKELTRLLRPR